MISALGIGAHLALDAWLGWVLLCLSRRRPLTAEHVPSALLLGMYAETLWTCSVIFLGLPLPWAAATMLLPLALISVYAWQHRLIQRPVSAMAAPRWYEWLLFATVLEKVAFALWQLARTPLYFDDALTHWSGRSRALFAGINWSLDPASPLWLGYDPYARHYPLLTVVWRAETACLCGRWDDLLARADGVVFFLAALASVWFAVLRFSQARWFAALAVFFVAALPLQAWHAAAGYSDIAVEALAVAALAALLRQEWLLAGVLAAGTGWAKNDGLVIFMPALLLGAWLCAATWRDALRFLLGCASLAPWLLIKSVLALGVAPNQERFVWHRDAFGLLIQHVFLGPTSSIFWIGIALALLLSGRALWRDQTGRALLVVLGTQATCLFVVYGCTESYRWLANEGTIHRSMLQVSATALVIAAYGMWRRFTSSPS